MPLVSFIRIHVYEKGFLPRCILCESPTPSVSWQDFEDLNYGSYKTLVSVHIFFCVISWSTQASIIQSHLNFRKGNCRIVYFAVQENRLGPCIIKYMDQGWTHRKLRRKKKGEGKVNVHHCTHTAATWLKLKIGFPARGDFLFFMQINENLIFQFNFLSGVVNHFEFWWEKSHEGHLD